MNPDDRRRAASSGSPIHPVWASPCVLDRLDGWVGRVPRHHACDYSQSQVLPGLEGNEPLQHFQQTGTATGSVTLGDTTLTIDGASLRDRTWGFRDEAASWVEYYACLFLFDDFLRHNSYWR